MITHKLETVATLGNGPRIVESMADVSDAAKPGTEAILIALTLKYPEFSGLCSDIVGCDAALIIANMKTLRQSADSLSHFGRNIQPFGECGRRFWGMIWFLSATRGSALPTMMRSQPMDSHCCEMKLMPSPPVVAAFSRVCRFCCQFGTVAAIAPLAHDNTRDRFHVSGSAVICIHIDYPLLMVCRDRSPAPPTDPSPELAAT